MDKKILAMSLKYQFVTPLTSMVVTLPNNSKADLRSDAVEKPTPSGAMGIVPQGITHNKRYQHPSLHFYPPIQRSVLGLSVNDLNKGKKTSRGKSKKIKFARTQGTRQLPAFFVNISTVNMCFDLPLEKSKRYSIINMVHQKNGCSMFAEPFSPQTGTSENTILSLKLNKFRGRKLQETFFINSSQSIPQVECEADGIRLDVTSSQGVRVMAAISGRQRKQYNGILSRFINMKCKVVKRISRKGKRVVKIKCRQRGKPILKLKAIEKTVPSGKSCLFLNKKMTNLLNLIPSKYETVP